MHETAYLDMERLLASAPAWTRNVLDVGSYDENGTHRPQVEGRGWSYTGIDIREGPNVDLIVGPYRYPFEDNSFDLVISGQTMEHVEDLKAWINECVRVLKPGGRLCIVTVWRMFYHPFPVDTWRIMPDGFRWLFNQTGQLDNYDIQMQDDGTIYGAATKKDGS